MSLINYDSIRKIVEKSFRSHGFSGTQGTADYEMAWKRNIVVSPGEPYQQTLELKVNLQDFRDVIAEAIYTTLTDKIVDNGSTLSSGNTKGEQSITNINDNFNINEALYINGIGTSAQIYTNGQSFNSNSLTTNLLSPTTNISSQTTNISSQTTNINGSSLLNIYGGVVSFTGSSISINNPTATQLAARKGDSIDITNATDPQFIGWIAAVDAFILNSSGSNSQRATYISTMTALGGVPTNASGLITSGSSGVKIGG